MASGRLEPSSRLRPSLCWKTSTSEASRTTSADLKDLMPFIGGVPLDRLHIGTLQPWIAHKRRQGRKAGTINNGLQIVRRIVNLAAGEWVDEHGLTWLQSPPQDQAVARSQREGSRIRCRWDEQSNAVPRAAADILAEMALFAVNTGCRDREVCGLRWELGGRGSRAWHLGVHRAGPAGQERRRSAGRSQPRRSICDRGASGMHPTHVFTFDGKPMSSMLNSAWKKARQARRLADGPSSRSEAHLRAPASGGRSELRGSPGPSRHRSGRITTHYSAAELSRLIEAAERVPMRERIAT